MTSRIVHLPGGRTALEVPADDAGEFLHVVVCRDIVERLQAGGLLTWRQAEALHTLARLRRAAGLRAAWHKPGSGERPDEAMRAANDELASLLTAIPEPTQTHVMHMLATDEWQIAARVSRIQDAADAVADRLKLPHDDA